MKNPIIGIIGLGYVGLPLSCVFLNKKYKVIGFDIDNNKLQMLKQKRLWIKENFGLLEL